MRRQQCERCSSVPPPLTFRCWSCGKVAHAHLPVLEEVEPMQALSVECPNCQKPNVMRMPRPKVLVGIPLAVTVRASGLQPDLPGLGGGGR